MSEQNLQVSGPLTAFAAQRFFLKKIEQERERKRQEASLQTFEEPRRKSAVESMQGERSVGHPPLLF